LKITEKQFCFYPIIIPSNRRIFNWVYALYWFLFMLRVFPVVGAIDALNLALAGHYVFISAGTGNNGAFKRFVYPFAVLASGLFY